MQVKKLFAATLIIALATASLATAQTTNDGPRVAAYSQLEVTKSKSKPVQFAKRTPEVGDRIDQLVEVELTIKSTTRQGEKVIDDSSTKLERLEQRILVADRVVEGQPIAGRVRFTKSQQRTNEGDYEPQPIAGKTYKLLRKDDQLVVTRADDSLPSIDEHELVAGSMESFGRVNPLGKYFAGRTINVGDKLSLPKEVGEGLLGTGDGLGKVVRFDMTLREVINQADGPVARFDAEVESRDGSNMQLVVSGKIDIETQTCRTSLLELGGPFGRIRKFGSHSQPQITSISGKLTVRMQAGYTDKK